MAVTHKRLWQEHADWTRYCGLRVACGIFISFEAARIHWEHVTCKKCLKLRPKGKR